MELRVDNLYRVPLKSCIGLSADVASAVLEHRGQSSPPETSQDIGYRVWGKRSRKSLQASLSVLGSYCAPAELRRYEFLRGGSKMAMKICRGDPGASSF